MKQLLYLVMSLIVIAAIIPGTSAVEDITEYYGWTHGNTTWIDQTAVDNYYTQSWCCLETSYCAPPGGSASIASTFEGSAMCGSSRKLANLTNYAWNGSAYSRYTKFYAGPKPTAFVDFSGIPTSGSAPLSVAFTATNLSNTTGLSWTFGDGNITTINGNTITHLYPNQGIYTVKIDYTNYSGVSTSLQKNNYITVGTPNATKTKWFQTIDGTNGNIVLNSSIQLKDVENSSWVNATGLINDGMSSITTLEGHHINAYAQALGYSDADDLNILMSDSLPRQLMMWPTFAKNVSAGNVSLYVTVKDKDTKANIVGAQVIVSTPQGSQSTATNAAGIAYFVVSNNTMCLVTASAQGLGYLAATTTINTGSANGGSAAAAATILLGRSTTILPTYVPTTLPGQPGVTPGPTPLPGCEDTISPEGQEKCRAAQSNQGLSWLSGNLLGFIQICFVVTILYLLGIKLGK